MGTQQVRPEKNDLLICEKFHAMRTQNKIDHQREENFWDPNFYILYIFILYLLHLN